jgi:hypothetical protein
VFDGNSYWFIIKLTQRNESGEDNTNTVTSKMENLFTLHKFLFESVEVKMHATSMRDTKFTKQL